MCHKQSYAIVKTCEVITVLLRDLLKPLTMLKSREKTKLCARKKGTCLGNGLFKKIQTTIDSLHELNPINNFTGDQMDQENHAAQLIQVVGCHWNRLGEATFITGFSFEITQLVIPTGFKHRDQISMWNDSCQTRVVLESRVCKSAE